MFERRLILPVPALNLALGLDTVYEQGMLIDLEDLFYSFQLPKAESVPRQGLLLAQQRSVAQIDQLDLPCGLLPVIGRCHFAMVSQPLHLNKYIKKKTSDFNSKSLSQKNFSLRRSK